MHGSRDVVALSPFIQLETFVHVYLHVWDLLKSFVRLRLELCEVKVELTESTWIFRRNGNQTLAELQGVATS
jgi:hypothetical protein